MAENTLVTKSLSPAARFAIVCVGGALVTALAARVSLRLPGTPVPLTLQTFAVLGIGALTPRFARPGAAVSSQLLYLALGFAGLPLFAEAGGATLGYLLAFPAAALLASHAAEQPFVRRVLTLGAASLIVLASGAVWIAWTTGVSLVEALRIGVVPFVLFELAKAVLLSGVGTRRNLPAR